VRRRLRNEEDGFTLVEALVAMVLMLTVMFALYSIFDMSLRVFSFGNDKTEAVENARVGVSRMEREIRAAYPEDRANNSDTLFYPGTDSDTIVFRNDLNGDNVTDSTEEITYEVSADGTKLLRNGDSAVENLSSVNFDYQTAQGASTTFDAAEIVEIDLTVSVDGRTQTINTDVSLRNRSS
jgi:Tfp pilus assembly protein PilW